MFGERKTRHIGVLLAILGVTLIACGHAPLPKRGVVEHDIDGWKFRRYQQLQDVEVWVGNNPATAHTASYVRDRAEREGRIGDEDLVNVVVTRYREDRGIVRATIVFVRRLVQESGYQVDEDKRAGVRLLTITGRDEKWVLWPADKHVVKIGGRYVDEIPKQLIEAHGERYPSRLKSGMLDGPLPEDPGAEDGDKKDEEEEYDPDNPTPDWEQYKKNKDGNKSGKGAKGTRAP